MKIVNGNQIKDSILSIHEFSLLIPELLSDFRMHWLKFCFKRNLIQINENHTLWKNLISKPWMPCQLLIFLYLLNWLYLCRKWMDILSVKLWIPFDYVSTAMLRIDLISHHHHSTMSIDIQGISRRLYKYKCKLSCENLMDLLREEKRWKWINQKSF